MTNSTSLAGVLGALIRTNIASTLPPCQRNYFREVQVLSPGRNTERSVSRCFAPWEVLNI